MKWLMIVWFGFCATTTFASEPMRLRGANYDYSFDPEIFVLGYTAGLLPSGYLLGTLLKTNGMPAAQKPEDLRPALKSAIDTNTNAKADAQKQTQSNLESLNGEPAIAPPPPVEAPPAQAAPAADPVDGKVCLGEALRLLKMRMNQKRSSAQRDAASARLEEHRGAGGIYCAKTLPLIDGAVLNDDVTQIKILSALLAREGDERQRILQAAKLALTPNPDGDFVTTWRLLLKEILVDSVFKKEPLPAWPDMLLGFENLNQEQTISPDGPAPFTIRVNQKKIDHAANLQKGLALLETGHDKN